MDGWESNCADSVVGSWKEDDYYAGRVINKHKGSNPIRLHVRLFRQSLKHGEEGP